MTAKGTKELQILKMVTKIAKLLHTRIQKVTHFALFFTFYYESTHTLKIITGLSKVLHTKLHFIFIDTKGQNKKLNRFIQLNHMTSRLISGYKTE